MQLVELQAVYAKLVEQNIALFAISYDPAESLGAFGAKHSIAYPLLSDAGSDVIRALGLLDEDLDAHHAEFGGSVRDEQRGVCYPGVFLLDERGTVAQRRFQRNYRVRESGAGILEHALGIASPEAGPVHAIAHERVRIRAQIDSATYWRYQRLYAIVDVDIAEGWHLYASSAAEDYVPLTIDLRSSDILVGEPAWPESRPFEFSGLSEAVRVFDGTLRVTVPFEFGVQRGEQLRDRNVAITVRYQACTQALCYRPQQATFELLLHERPAAD